MPMHETVPGTRTLVYIHPKQGKFEATVDGQTKELGAIEGKLDLVRLEFDPGNPANKIQPYDAFIMHISDEEYLFRIKMNVERQFVYSVMKVLNDLKKGDHLLLKASPGNDPMVTFCNIEKIDEAGNKSYPVQEQLPTDLKEKLEFIKKTIEAHSAYSPKKLATE